MVHCLGFSAFTAMALGSIPDWRTKISQAAKHGQINKLANHSHSLKKKKTLRSKKKSNEDLHKTEKYKETALNKLFKLRILKSESDLQAIETGQVKLSVTQTSLSM